jgi:aspartyl protease family protein
VLRWIGGASCGLAGLLILNLAAPEPQLRGGLDIIQAKAVTELKADARGHFITDAGIEGTTLKVIVDTGASAVALSYEDADRAGLRPFALRYDVPVATANGVARAARVTLRRVEVNGIMVRDVDGLVLPEGVMHGTLLGMSYLGRLRSFKVEGGVLHLED